MDFIISTLLGILLGTAIIYGTFSYFKQLQRHEEDRNTLSNAVLEILRSGEMHGYQLAKWIQVNKPYLLKLSPGVSLFPILGMLEDKGYIQSRTQLDKETDRLRRYYSLVKDKGA